MDPRALMAPDSLERSIGMWGQSTNTPMQFQIQLTEPVYFNLSLYSCSADQGYNALVPLQYTEQLGRDLTFTVVDAKGTQSYRMFNNAAGEWITFPVHGDANTPITVTVAPTAGFTTANVWISAVAFDPYESHRTEYTYNATSDMTSVTNGLGQRVEMKYNSNGTVSSVVDPLGRVTSFTYGDTALNLTAVTDPMGNVTSYTYDSNGNMLTVTNPRGHAWTYGYDGQNRVLSVVDPLTHRTDVTYDSAGNILTVVDANTRTTQLFYNSSNRLKRIVDAGGQTRFLGYDASGNMTTFTNSLGNLTTFQYDSAHRVSQVTLPDGNVITYRYDGQNRLRAITPPNGTQSDTTQLRTANAYNWLLNPGAETIEPSTLNLALQEPQAWTHGYDSTYARRDGNSASAHSGTASFWSNMSSGAGWQQSNIPVPPGSTLATRQWSKTDLTTILRTHVDYFDVTGTVQGVAMSNFYTDSVWQQSPWARTTLPGDAQFPRTALQGFRFKPDVQSNNYSARFDDFEMYMLSTALYYDNEGRSSATLQPDGGGVTVVRDRYARITQTIDGRGRATGIRYDALNRVTAVMDPDLNITTYSYDAVQNFRAFTDARGSTTDYSYDTLDRLTSIKYPDGTTELFTYDAASNLATYTNNRGQKRTFSYDNAERVTTVVYNTDSTQVALTYDNASNVLTVTERNGDVITYTYDSLNRVLTELRTVPAAATTPAWSHAHSWDAEGNRLSFNMDSGSRYNSAHYNRDPFYGKGLTWSIPGGYTPMGLTPAYQDRAGRQTRFTYSVDSLLQSVTFPNGTPSTIYTVGHDVVGKINTISANIGA
ncbi:MAG: hypothetical protein PSX37_09385, partial [bacterium]|nr:hypothetical protein [bacterium]